MRGPEGASVQQCIGATRHPASALAEVDEQVAGLLGGPLAGGVRGDAQDACGGCRARSRPGRTAAAASTVSTCKKSHARIAAAWERRNCRQVGADRRGAGSIPAILRISHTVEAAIFTPKPGQFTVDPAVPPAGVLPGQPQDQGPDVPAGRRAAGLAVHGPGGPAAADDVAVPAQAWCPG